MGIFLVHSYQKPQPGSNRKEGDREAKRDGERERKKEKFSTLQDRKYHHTQGMVRFPGGPVVKDPPANAGDMGSIPGLEDPLEKEMATHSSILAWEIQWTGSLLGYSACIASVVSDSL